MAHSLKGQFTVAVETWWKTHEALVRLCPGQEGGTQVHGVTPHYLNIWGKSSLFSETFLETHILRGHTQVFHGESKAHHYAIMVGTAVGNSSTMAESPTGLGLWPGLSCEGEGLEGGHGRAWKGSRLTSAVHPPLFTHPFRCLSLPPPPPSSSPLPFLLLLITPP